MLLLLYHHIYISIYPNQEVPGTMILAFVHAFVHALVLLYCEQRLKLFNNQGDNNILTHGGLCSPRNLCKLYNPHPEYRRLQAKRKRKKYMLPVYIVAYKLNLRYAIILYIYYFFVVYTGKFNVYMPMLRDLDTTWVHYNNTADITTWGVVPECISPSTIETT